MHLVGQISQATFELFGLLSHALLSCNHHIATTDMWCAPMSTQDTRRLVVVITHACDVTLSDRSRASANPSQFTLAEQAGENAQKSTVEDQLHEAEADKNASAFVKV